MEVKYHPIIFSTPMITAILNGSKVQTRRIIKPQPIPQSGSPFGFAMASNDFEWPENKSFQCGTVSCKKAGPDGWVKRNSKWEIGDMLWVRETWVRHNRSKFMHYLCFQSGQLWYKYRAEGKENYDIGEKIKWKPSIFMPREASRIILKITDIKVERLQDISEEDARKEGVMPTKYTSTVFKSFLGYKNYYPQDAEDKGVLKTAKESFKTLWHSINGEESWNHNPWVWAISFSPIKTPQ